MEPAAFDALLQRHTRTIRGVAFAYCRDAAERDDVAQEIAVQLWRAADRFDGRSRESTWVYRIALNVAISIHRRQRRGQQRREPLLAEPAAPPPAEPGEAVQQLLACVEQELPPLDRALVLLWLEGQDHAAIGEVLGISVSNVGTRLHRLKDTLRRALARRGITTASGGAEDERGTR